MRPLEQAILETVHTLQPNAYGVTIQNLCEERLGYVSYGSVYRAIEKLEELWMITTKRGDPTPERGGRAKLFVFLTPIGERAISVSQK